MSQTGSSKDHVHQQVGREAGEESTRTQRPRPFMWPSPAVYQTVCLACAFLGWITGGPMGSGDGWGSTWDEGGRPWQLELGVMADRAAKAKVAANWGASVGAVVDEAVADGGSSVEEG